ncbi:hypothetical protein MLD38_028419 [Melastoma candidum]|nr:hypothetical protein MLD38_028419 [Melastoma candidum]
MESPKSSPSPSSASTPFPCPLNPSPGLPGEFVWSREGPGPLDLVPALDVPVIDLGGFLRGELEETSRAIELVRAACMAHGFFQVIGHGVDLSLIDAAYDATDRVFGMPMSRKVGLRRKEGTFWGYSYAHSDRYSSNLPWKETFTFGFEHNQAKSTRGVVDYFADMVGRDFVHVG